MERVIKLSGALANGFASWIADRFKRRKVRDGRLSAYAAAGSVLFGMVSMAAAALGMPTGLGWYVDVPVMLALTAAGMYIAAAVGAFILSLLYVPVPRRFVSLWFYAAAQTYIILYYAEMGVAASAVIAALYSTAGAAVGMTALLAWTLARNGKWVPLTAAAAVVAAAVVWLPWNEAANGPSVIPERAAEADPIPAGRLAWPEAEDPSLPGPFDYRFFHYGSGTDKHRAGFGGEVSIVTNTADASAYITKWPKLKTRFWGFDQKSVPLNGRVWMPEGAGPFPIALIVHGNHLMEYFSDAGYAYLGKLLASKGIVAVSVDENFLNYSVWSGIPNDDMKVRAWVLLKHLEELNRLSRQAGNAFYGRIDWSRVALIGHSRGGQAAAMAAGADQWFPDDPVLDSLRGVRVASVAAIAPTDKRVNQKTTTLKNVNYLTIQGSADGDVHQFSGDRQYHRVKLDGSSEAFKASLYIAGANHSQFNTDWGRMDERLPGGLFLNRSGMLKPEEQRQIAKVYIVSFMEATLNGRDEYKALFQDYRSAGGMLPETAYFSRYGSSDMVEIASFEAYDPLVHAFEGDEFAVRERMQAADRDGSGKGTYGMALQWEEPGAEFTIRLKPEAGGKLEGTSGGSLVLSLMNMERDLAASEDPALDKLPPLPQIEIGLTERDGKAYVLALNEWLPVEEPVYTQFLISGWLDRYGKNNKYKNANEPVFQTYVIPLELFEPAPDKASAAASALPEPGVLESVSIRFSGGPGKFMVDDIGFVPEGGTYVNYKR